MKTLYHQTKTLISFWCRCGLNRRFLIQRSKTLLMELIGIYKGKHILVQRILQKKIGLQMWGHKASGIHPYFVLGLRSMSRLIITCKMVIMATQKTVPRISRKSCCLPIKCSTTNTLVVLMWRRPLNSTTLVTPTHRRPEGMSDGTSTQVMA